MRLTLTPTAIRQRARHHQVLALISFCGAFGLGVMTIAIGSYILAAVNIMIMVVSSVVYQGNSRIVHQCNSMLKPNRARTL